MDFFSPPSHPNLSSLESLCGVWQELAPPLAEVRREIGRKTLSLDGDKLLGDVNPASG